MWATLGKQLGHKWGKNFDTTCPHLRQGLGYNWVTSGRQPGGDWKTPGRQLEEKWNLGVVVALFGVVTSILEAAAEFAFDQQGKISKATLSQTSIKVGLATLTILCLLWKESAITRWFGLREKIVWLIQGGVALVITGCFTWWAAWVMEDGAYQTIDGGLLLQQQLA